MQAEHIHTCLQIIIAHQQLRCQTAPEISLRHNASAWAWGGGGDQAKMNSKRSGRRWRGENEGAETTIKI
jgi:hypothetical protein